MASATRTYGESVWDACLNLGHNEVLQFAKEATITRRDIFKASWLRFKSTFAPDGQTSSVSDSVELLVCNGCS